MTPEDDDHEDDPRVSSMRSVWRSMRDEDPPQRGIDALLAAAREQAASMHGAARTEHASWWTRLMAALRRPPVLAFASVTVIVAGAAVIVRRGDELATRPEVSIQSPSSDSTTAGSAAPSTETENEQLRAAAGAPSSGAASEHRESDEGGYRPPAPEPQVTRDGLRQPMPASKPNPEPRPSRRSATNGPSRPQAFGGAADHGAESSMPADRPAKEALDRGERSDEDEISSHELTERPPAAVLEPEGTGAAPVVTPAPPPRAPGSAPSVATLKATVLELAARNDCPGARRALQALATRDRATADKLRTDPKVAACLPR